MAADSNGKRGRGRPKAFDRAEVVDTAMTLLWEKGPGALSVNELCESIGVSKPGLYREFGGDDGLLAAALERYYAVRIAPLLVKLCQDQPLADALTMLARWMATPNTPLPAGCLFAKARTTLQPLGPQASAQIVAMRQTQLETLTAWMKAAKRRGDLSHGISADLAGRYVDTQLTMLLRLVGDGEPPKSIEAQTRLAFAGIMRQDAGA
ncbi:MAG: TetR/AcrR family transcriptional regulator [Pseudomonadota bacterium]